MRCQQHTKIKGTATKVSHDKKQNNKARKSKKQKSFQKLLPYLLRPRTHKKTSSPALNLIAMKCVKALNNLITAPQQENGLNNSLEEETFGYSYRMKSWKRGKGRK